MFWWHKNFLNQLIYNAIIFIKVTTLHSFQLSVVWCRTFWTVKSTTTGWVLCDVVHCERWRVLQLQRKRSWKQRLGMLPWRRTVTVGQVPATPGCVSCEILSCLSHKPRNYDAKEDQLTLYINGDQVMLIDRTFSVFRQMTERKFVCYIA